MLGGRGKLHHSNKLPLILKNEGPRRATSEDVIGKDSSVMIKASVNARGQAKDSLYCRSKDLHGRPSLDSKQPFI